MYKGYEVVVQLHILNKPTYGKWFQTGSVWAQGYMYQSHKKGMDHSHLRIEYFLHLDRKTLPFRLQEYPWAINPTSYQKWPFLQSNLI